MKPLYVYPGTFCPPTYGHLRIVQKAAEIFNHILILCSVNPDKNSNWFTPEECCSLWSTYDLPDNVNVKTLDEFKASNPNMSSIIMIRGIRDDNDFEHEKEVMFLNSTDFGIDKYFYLVSEEEYKHISSSAVRKLADNLQLKGMVDYVSPLIISALLEYILQIENIFLVVGKPGSGKSTFLKMVMSNCTDCAYVNTDEFSDKLKPLLQKSFPGEDLIKLALEREDELKAVIADSWMDLLVSSLKAVAGASQMFVEIPYGLQTDKNMFRFVGGKIIYIGCNDDKKCRKRITDRGTPELLGFFDKIPGFMETIDICNRYNLNLTTVETNVSLEALETKATSFIQRLKKEK